MRFFLFFFILPVSFNCIGQSDSTAGCIAYWKKGEQRKLSITKITEKGENNQPPERTSLAFEATITVLDSSDSGFLLQWVYQVPEKLKKDDPFMAQAMAMYMGMNIEFYVTETGAFKELKNWEKLRDFYIGMMERSLPRNQDSTTAVAIAKTRELFSSKEMVEASLIREIQLYYMPYGYEFSVKEVSAATELPNPFGGEALPAVQTFQVKDINPLLDQFTLSVKQELNPGATKELLESMITKLGIKDAKGMEEVRKMLASFYISDKSEYIFLRSSGWVKKLVFTRTAQTDQFSKTEQYLIELTQ